MVSFESKIKSTPLPHLADHTAKDATGLVYNLAPWLPQKGVPGILRGTQHHTVTQRLVYLWGAFI